MSDSGNAIFGTNGAVNGSGGRRIASAWSGAGSDIAQLLGSADMPTLPSLLGTSGTTSSARGVLPKYTYSQPAARKDYSAAEYSKPKASSLLSGDTQSVLQQYIDAVASGYLSSISGDTRDAVNQALGQYQALQQAAQAQRDEQNLNTLLNTQNGTGGGIRDALNAYNSLTAGAGPTETRNFVNQASNAGIDRNSLLAIDALNRSWQKKGYI